MARVSKQTLLSRSDKNMASGTHPVVRESALEVVSRAYDEGINVQISEGHRPNSRQNALYAQGRTKPGNIVTNARAGQSWHNYGIAVDFFLTNKSGSKAIWTVNNDWRRVAQIGKNLGFEWGGDWTSFRDYPHLQMTGGLSLAQMRAGKKPNLTSKVDNPIKPSGSSSSSSGGLDYTTDAKYPKKGNFGPNVLKMQRALNDRGYNVAEDSSFGPDADKKLRQFQKDNNLAVDGQNGPATQEVLYGYNDIAADGWFGPGTAKKAQQVYNLSIVDGVVSGQPKNFSTRNIPSAEYGTSGSNLLRAMAKEFGVPAKYRDGKITVPSMLVERMQRHYGTIVDKKISGPSNVIKEWQKALNKGKRK